MLNSKEKLSVEEEMEFLLEGEGLGVGGENQEFA